MAANLETFMWTGTMDQMPWHMTKETMWGYEGEGPITARETITKAGLDWRVGLHPAAVEIDGAVYRSQDIMAIVRDRDCKMLGTCTQKYIPIQNTEAFEFLDAVAEGVGQLRYVTAGAIDGGRRVWMLAKLIGDGFDLEPLLGDKVNMFLLLTSGHDGKNSLKCKFTSVRIVCQNTLNLALRTGEDGVNIKHIGDPLKKVQAAREILGLATEEAEAFRKVSVWLAAQRADTAYTRDFLEIMAPTEGKGPKAITRAENIQKDLLMLSVNGKGTHLQGVVGTRWGLLNAVTEYNTHERNFRNTEQSGADTNKFDALFSGGVAEKMNLKALDFLLADAPEAVYKAPKRVTKELELV